MKTRLSSGKLWILTLVVAAIVGVPVAIHFNNWQMGGIAGIVTLMVGGVFFATVL